MSSSTLDRRRVLAASMVIASGLASAQAQAAKAQPPWPAAVPLPFDVKRAPGLSEALLTSHHDNNYVGAVKRLAAIRTEIAGLDPVSVPGYRLNGLKREELIAWNSMILHEVYFAGLGEPVRPAPPLAQAIERDFGSHDRWAAEFTGMGKALGGGSGWVLLTYSRHDGRLVNAWAADHTMAVADGAPILALDMYEHAYHLDYGARAGAYVDAFMKAMTWRNANQAFQRASVA
jgi:Fe-Mn family superoxide dismutase